MMTNYGQPSASPRNRSLALLAGLLTAIVGAVVWGLIAALARQEFSFVAVIIGLAVGGTIAAVRRGAADVPLAVGSAVIAIAGCALGSLLGVVFVLLRHGVTGSEMLSHLNLVLQAWRSDLNALSVAFWAIAAFAAVRFTLGRGIRRRSTFGGYGPSAAAGSPAGYAGQQPAPGFGQPGPGFGQPAPGLGQPAPGLGQHEPGHGGADSGGAGDPGGGGTGGGRDPDGGR